MMVPLSPPLPTPPAPPPPTVLSVTPTTWPGVRGCMHHAVLGAYPCPSCSLWPPEPGSGTVFKGTALPAGRVEEPPPSLHLLPFTCPRSLISCATWYSGILLEIVGGSEQKRLLA